MFVRFLMTFSFIYIKFDFHDLYGYSFLVTFLHRYIYYTLLCVIMLCYVIKCEATISVIVIEEVIMDGYLALVHNKNICEGI